MAAEFVWSVAFTELDAWCGNHPLAVLSAQQDSAFHLFGGLNRAANALSNPGKTQKLTSCRAGDNNYEFG